MSRSIHCKQPPGFKTRRISARTLGHSSAVKDNTMNRNWTKSIDHEWDRKKNQRKRERLPNDASGNGMPRSTFACLKSRLTGRMSLGHRSEISIPLNWQWLYSRLVSHNQVAGPQPTSKTWIDWWLKSICWKVSAKMLLQVFQERVDFPFHKIDEKDFFGFTILKVPW